jgi:6-phosphogluconolactonase (cycloisomerase 2 family)
MSILDSSGTVSSGSSTAFADAIGGYAIAANNLLYVTSATPQGSGLVNGYTFDPAKGTVTQVSSTPIQANSEIAVDPTGNFLYVGAFIYPSNGPSYPAVYEFSIDSATGKLTPLSGSPDQFSGDNEAGQMAVSPDGGWLCLDMVAGESIVDVTCVARHADGTVGNDSSGTSISPITGMNGGGQIAFTPDGQWVFAAGSVNATIEEGSMKNPTNPATATGSAFSTGIAVDPSGKWLVVAEQPKTLAVYSIGSNGQLTAGSTTTLPAAPGQIAFSKSGDLFVTTDSGTAAYSFNNTSGTLTALSGSPVPGTQSQSAFGNGTRTTPIAAQ